jgi:DNA helicase II / ATP-dependent DNA helicase PcrA
MIEWEEFGQIVVNNLGRDIKENKNPDQNKAVSAPIDQSQFIVAGPGIGKSTFTGTEKSLNSSILIFKGWK